MGPSWSFGNARRVVLWLFMVKSGGEKATDRLPDTCQPPSEKQSTADHFSKCVSKPWKSKFSILLSASSFSFVNHIILHYSFPQALNCIMEMVEKTRRSMAVLRRCQEVDREELNYWKRRYNESSELRKGSEHSSRQHSPTSTESGTNGENASGYITSWFPPRHETYFKGSSVLKRLRMAALEILFAIFWIGFWATDPT